MPDFLTLSEADRTAIVTACREDWPETATRLVSDYCSLTERHAETSRLLEEASKILAEQQGTAQLLAAFIDLGPPLPDGTPTALVDRGGTRVLVPVPGCVSPSDLLAEPTVLLNPFSQLVGTLPGYLPPAEVGTVVESENAHLLVEIGIEGKVRLDLPERLRGAFKRGDRALVDKNHGMIVGQLPAEENPGEWRVEVSPPERFRDVAGQEGAIETIEERILWPLERPDLMHAFGLGRSAGILLHGPTGCGKTLLGRATAGELSSRFGRDCAFLRVKAGALKSKWYGETTARIARLWDFARREASSGRIVVLFIDEVDSLGSNRGGGAEMGYGMAADRDATNSLLAELEGFDTDRSLPIVTIASTNLPGMLDPAFMGRFGVQIRIARPDPEGTAAMMRLHLNHGTPTEMPVGDLVDCATGFIFDEDRNVLLAAHLRDGQTTELIRRSHLVTGRLVRDAVEQAKWFAVGEVIRKNAPPTLKLVHLLLALEEKFVGIARKLTADNLGGFCDLPSVQGGMVARLEPAGSR